MNRSPTLMRWKRHRVGGEGRQREGNEENLVEVTKVTQEEPIDPKKPSLFSSTRMLVRRKSLRDFPKKKNEDSAKRKSTKKSKTKNLVKKNSDQDGLLLLEQLMDDVQLHVLEFLSPASARALMSTSHRYRRLLQGEKALSYWKHWCRKLWPDCAQDASFVDSLNLPTAAGYFYKEANLALLLSMAKPSPSKIDESLFNDQEKNLLELKQPPQDVELVTPDVTKAPQARHSCEQMVQFKGEVGTGNRCIRSDLPLAACPISSPNKKISTLRRLLGDSGLSCRGMSSSSSAVLVLAGPQPPSSAAVLHQGERPFVVPHTGPDGQIHLTPRFISYYEVTISDKNKEHDDGTTNHSSSRSSTHEDEDALRPPTGEEEEEGPRPECVAVGLAVEDFPLDSRMPGWNSFSIGYHGDNGCLYYCTGGTFEMKEFGPTFSTGDTVGCGIDFVRRDVFFTLNGKFLGYACAKNLFLDGMYPTVGLDTNAPIGCNFGSQPFLYDLSSTMQQHGSIIRNQFSF